MKILVITQYFWPENFKINDVVIDLSARNHHVTVLTGVPNYPEGFVFKEFEKNPKRFENYGGANIIRVPMLARGESSIRLALNYLSFALSATFFGSYKLRKQEFDVIFVFEPSPITVGIPAIFFRKTKNAPVVFWVQDLWPESLEAVGVIRSKVIIKMVACLVRYIYRRCDLILAQSKSFIHQIKKYSNNFTPVIYLPNWAEKIFHLSDLDNAKEIPLLAGSFDVMFAGNIGEAQDFQSILAAAELTKNNKLIRWLIVGDGRMAEWVAEQIKIRCLKSTVIMLGRHPVEKMPSFFRHADALLVSLKDEPIFSMTIPGKLQSYLAAGKPIVTMLNGEGASVIIDSGAGVSCRAGDFQGLADSVSKLASMSAQELEVMGMKALEYTDREFNRAKLISKLELLLEQTKLTKLDKTIKV